MQSSSSPSVSLPDSSSETNQFDVTILDNRILLVRLATELDRLLRELRWAINQLRQDPAGFTRVIASNALLAIRRQLTPTNLVGLASALLIIGSLALLVAMFERRHPPRSTEVITEETDRPLVLVLTETSDRGRASIYPPSTGRVGMSSGRGEGSSPVPGARAQGGGSGGDRDLLPEQVGKVPQPSEVPAVIPTEPPKYSPSLPAAGVDLDPKLWADVTFAVYGSPYSQSTLKSHGPGENGGIGTNNGLGVGNGRGNGFGEGNDGNTGGGNRQIGCCGGGGTVGGGSGSNGNPKPGGGGGYDQRVRLIAKPEPHYTEEARRQGTVGTVILRVVFSSTGEITQIRAINGLPFGLTERAIAAARAIKFVPAMKNGQPVSVFMQLEYNFNLY